jgi:hypothetical protein
MFDIGQDIIISAAISTPIIIKMNNNIMSIYAWLDTFIMSSLLLSHLHIQERGKEKRG